MSRSDRSCPYHLVLPLDPLDLYRQSGLCFRSPLSTQLGLLCLCFPSGQYCRWALSCQFRLSTRLDQSYLASLWFQSGLFGRPILLVPSRLLGPLDLYHRLRRSFLATPLDPSGLCHRLRMDLFLPAVRFRQANQFHPRPLFHPETLLALSCQLDRSNQFVLEDLSDQDHLFLL